MEKPAEKTRVIGYLRVSTDKQASEGHSLEAQRERLEGYAVAMQLRIVEIISDEGVSGKLINRPGLDRALAMLKAGEADGLLILKLDRLTRSVKHLAELLPLFSDKLALLSVSDHIDTRSASGRLVLNVLTSVSQWEREAISERTKTVMAHLKAKGVVLGAPAMTGPVVDRMVELRNSGGSFREIAEMLNHEGFTPRRSSQWSHETVRQVLKRTRLGK